MRNSLMRFVETHGCASLTAMLVIIIRMCQDQYLFCFI